VGFDRDESATRFSNYLHVLRELVHLSCGHLALEPRFEVKALLGDHLYDDARAVSKIRRRLYELRAPADDPGAPSEELAQLLNEADEADTHAYLEIAYGQLKPTLVEAVRTHLERIDPLLDEPSLRLLTQLRHRQERHTAELPVGGAHAAFEDLGALPVRPGETRALRPLPPLHQPARDAFIEIANTANPDDRNRFFHDLMHAALCAAELSARNSHEHPDLPWDFHVDMARWTWDEIRHAEVLDRLMASELGCHWGDHPVAFDRFKQVYALDLPDRLALVGDDRLALVGDDRLALAGDDRLPLAGDNRSNELAEHGQRAIAEAFDADWAAHADRARALRHQLARTPVQSP
jgi:hypothetical protein